jgi:hypothetical protein
MRWINKPASSPASITDYIRAQSNVGHGLDYKTFAGTITPGGCTRGKQLCDELTNQQFGLCAYTGAGIDSRLGTLTDPNKILKFTAHNEHLKSQSECKNELRSSGKTYGCDIGDDMNHQNIVAALLVSGNGRIAKKDLFGAAHRGHARIAITPTNKSCENRFVFDEIGNIKAANPSDQDAIDTIDVLRLDHPTLTGWRKIAIETFLEGITTKEDAELIIEAINTPKGTQLPEYSFVIQQVIQSLMIKQNAS